MTLFFVLGWIFGWFVGSIAITLCLGYRNLVIKYGRQDARDAYRETLLGWMHR